MKVPTFDQVFAWCSESEQQPTGPTGWLTALLNGSVSLVEMRAAILERRAVNMPPDDHAQLAADLNKLPDSRGWYFGIEDEDGLSVSLDCAGRFVWRHPELDERVYCHPNRDRHELDVEVYPADGSGHTVGGCVAFPVRTAAALFESIRKWLDEYAVEDECETCLGVGRLRDGGTNELRRCLDCGGSGSAPGVHLGEGAAP
jgi:hypothetical protein